MSCFTRALLFANVSRNVPRMSRGLFPFPLSLSSSKDSSAHKHPKFFVGDGAGCVIVAENAE